MKKLKINYWAVIVVVVLSQLVPMIWYGVFAEQWMELNGLTMEMITEDASSPEFQLMKKSLLRSKWYLENEEWWQPLLARAGVGERLGRA